ncbi:phenylpropionate dioxygenase-like ring-hydroxylating dioxygenase large terminal subunit [Xanthomonas sacchari]|uniref:aromatic ring-hydroxylating oxygenase subunit alpha n=1 Tax=Xanthomonas sacchari TaxID=56458 RepID=UPI002782BCFF|nr:aromatic ring-hydroxylating dioxygenase subunit alpha [Xanthomonas sacchari]MDQ1094145.1 phenylpropionate dioxygenase-like ring-hydroxylating dioxygenase large terminal subunit [Xanthomonas sacchari]
MHSLMPAEAYIDETWFAREREQLLRPLWQFVAPRMLLDKPNAFVRRSVCGVDVVVQNIDGELRAFDNLCLHRQNPLQQQPQGVRPLVCSYHGWRYGADGGVDNIPFHDDAYRLAPEARACLRLRRFAVACIGKLVFVNLSDAPMPLEAQFSLEALEMLRAASEQFDDEVLVATFEADFNWKLAYENLRDALHPRFVHPRTLAQQVKFQVQMDDAGIAEARRYHAEGSASREAHLARLRDFSSGGLNEPLLAMAHYPWHAHVERFGNDDWYLNWLLYPNLHIASGSGGYSFIIEHHQPVSAQRTDLLVYYVTARKKHRYPGSDAVLLGHLHGAEKVLREDIEIMEQVQSGLRAGAPRAVLGDYEHANMQIERWYMDVMEGRHVL